MRAVPRSGSSSDRGVTAVSQGGEIGERGAGGRARWGTRRAGARGGGGGRGIQTHLLDWNS